jgi:hypothetical protein
MVLSAQSRSRPNVRLHRCGWDAHAAQIRRARTGSLQFSHGVGSTTVPKSFKIGDRVSWNSEAGRVSGTIVRVRTRNFKVNGYTHHASPDAPQYEIKSAKTDHIAFHKGSALTKLD